MQPSSDDEVYEHAKLTYPKAMDMLAEALFYELFLPGSRLRACGAEVHVQAKTVCWVRFAGRLRGQLLALQVSSIECGLPGRPTPEDAVLEACVRERLVIGEPIGIPAEAASELGDYTGPVELPLTWYPES